MPAPQRALLKIGFIYEGVTDQEILPVLIAKVLNRRVSSISLKKATSGFSDFQRPLTRPMPGLEGAWGTLKQYVNNLIIKGSDAIIVVVDNDCDRPEIVKRWHQFVSYLPYNLSPRPFRVIDASQNEPECIRCGFDTTTYYPYLTTHVTPDVVPIIVGVAVQMLEAWLLADPRVFERVLYQPFTQEEIDSCRAPENIVHPKNEIVAKRIGRDDLSEMQAREIARHHLLNPTFIANRCPSFSNLRTNVQTLHQIP